jgi:hypothetical protein
VANTKPGHFHTHDLWGFEIQICFTL